MIWADIIKNLLKINIKKVWNRIVSGKVMLNSSPVCN